MSKTNWFKILTPAFIVMGPAMGWSQTKARAVVLPKAAISQPHQQSSSSVKTNSKTVFVQKKNSAKLALVNTSQFKTDTRTRKSDDKKVISGAFEISRSSSLYDLKNGEKYDGMDYMLSLSYALDAGSISTKLGYAQSLNDYDGKQSTINDSNLTYAHQAQVITDNSRSFKMTWTPSATAIIPLSERSRDVEQLQTAMIGAISLKMIAGSETDLAGLGASLSVSVGQNFHQFETDKNGTILNKNSSNQTLAVFYSLGDWSFTVSYANRIRWPYRGDVRQSFELSEDITYTFLKDWSASIGHSNSGASLKPNGQDSNVSLVDDDNSVVYLGLGYSF